MAATRVGFIGLGIMGENMSRRLLQNNISLVVWNRSNEKCIKLKEEYDSTVTIANTPKEVLDLCTLNFVMLSTPEVCKDVYTKTDGILDGVSTGKRIVDCATLNAEDMQWASNEVIKRGGRFVEAPVGGSKGPAATGQLVFMTCGDKEVVDDAKDCFESMGKATHFISTNIGAGSKMKLIVNSIMCNVASVLSEGIHLADAANLDANDLLAILGQGSTANGIFAGKGPGMINNIHTPNFPLKHAWKDMRFAIAMANSLNVDCSMSQSAEIKFRQASEAGHDDLDFSAIHTSKKVKK